MVSGACSEKPAMNGIGVESSPPIISETELVLFAEKRAAEIEVPGLDECLVGLHRLAQNIGRGLVRPVIDTAIGCAMRRAEQRHVEIACGCGKSAAKESDGRLLEFH